MGSETKTGKVYTTFKDFYPFYLAEHSNQINKRLHYVGTSLSMLIILFAILTSQFRFLLVAVVSGYAFAWIGHFFFEKNKPATFQYPFFSFMGDFKMWYQITTQQIKF